MASPSCLLFFTGVWFIPFANTVDRTNMYNKRCPWTFCPIRVNEGNLKNLISLIQANYQIYLGSFRLSIAIFFLFIKFVFIDLSYLIIHLYFVISDYHHLVSKPVIFSTVLQKQRYIQKHLLKDLPSSSVILIFDKELISLTMWQKGLTDDKQR